MDLGTAGLSEQPFPTHGKPLAVGTFASKIAALEVLKETCEHRTGLSLIQGPMLSGKSTLIRSFVESLPENYSVAVIDGKGLNTTNLLMSVLRQFGYALELCSANELLGLLRVFALQQTASEDAPLLIIENADALNPSAMRALCELAQLRMRGASALKFVLLSDRSLQATMTGIGMEAMASRILHDFHLHPMTRRETKEYLRLKLRAAGSDYPDYILPDEVCADIWRASGGWPGIADRVALLAIAHSETLPVALSAVEHAVLPQGTWTEEHDRTKVVAPEDADGDPRLVVTNNGSVIEELEMHNSRAIIGRSEHNDISIGSRFVSRHHALLVRQGTATFLMDLNSTNGTFVNSRRVSNHVLMHEDVITLGNHRIKFYHQHATASETLDGVEFTDTTIMKTLEDIRDLSAQENTALLPAAPEDPPTIQN